MAVRNALFRAKARAEIKTVQITAYDAATTYSLTINGKSVTAIAAGSVNATATALAAAWNAATETEFTEVTASASTDTVTVTHDTAGVPFTVTSSVSGGAGTIGAVTTTTAATGPTFWNDLNNWDGAVPITGDTANVNLDLGSFTDGLDQSAVTLAVLNIFSASQQTTNAIGRKKINDGNYTEYRERMLKIGATLCKGDHGSSRVYLNFGSVQTSYEQRRSGAPDGDLPAVQLIGTHASNAWEIASGSASLAFYDDESAAGTTLRTGPNATIVCGNGCNVTTIDNLGTLDYSGDFTTLNNFGPAILRGDTSPTTINFKGSQVDYRLSGTVTNSNVGPGTCDKSNDMSPSTWTNTTLEEGGAIIDPAETLTFTNKVARGVGVRELRAA